MSLRTVALLIPLVTLITIPVPASEAVTGVVTGKILEFNEIEGYDQLTVLTQDGEHLQVRLGQAGACRELVIIGDLVDLRLCPLAPVNNIHLARKMRVRRSDASYTFRTRTGRMSNQWSRVRTRDGSCGSVPGDTCPQRPQQCPGVGSGPCGGGGKRGGGR